MTGQTDDLKGRAKEAAGALTDDDDLKRDGQSDQTASGVKEKIDDAGDWAKEKVDAVKDKIDRS